jgi:hypothetical protein
VNSYVDSPADIDLLWQASAPQYIRRTAGDGWYTIGEFHKRVNMNGSAIGYKAVATRMAAMEKDGKLEKGMTLVNGRPQVCYKAIMAKATLLVQTPTGPRPVRSKKPKRTRAPKRKAGTGKKGK